MKIKVNREKLIKALEAKQAELNQKVEEEGKGALEDVARYEQEAEKAIKVLKNRVKILKEAKTVAELVKALEAIENGDRVDLPQRPFIASRRLDGGGYTQHDLKQITQLLSRLKFSDQIEIECDDNADYLRFL